MQYNIWPDVCGFLLIAILIIIYLLKQTVTIFQNSIFYIGMMTVLFGTLLDVVRVALDGGDSLTVYAVNTVLLMLDLTTAFLYALYMTAYVRYHVSTKFVTLALVPPMILAAAMQVVNYFTGFIFIVDATGHFVWRATSGIFFLIAIYYVLLCLVLIFKVRDAMSREKLFLMIPFTVILIISGLIEFFRPHLLLKHFSEAMLALVLYFGIRNPDELYDDSTGMLNDTAMIAHIEKRLSFERKFFAVIVCIQDINLINKTVGRETWEMIKDQVTDFFFRHDRTTMSFRIAPGLYCMVPDRDDRGFACDIQNDVVERFSKSFGRKELETELTTSTIMLELPKDARDMSSLMDVIRLFSEVAVSKNMMVVSTADLDLKHIEYMRKVDEKVRHAIKEDRLEVYYQPIFSCSERRFVAAEALIRMHDDEHGFISPEVFVPVAENNGSIIKIDNFVMDRVCAMIAKNDLKKLGVHYIELNLSPGDCIQDDLVTKVDNLLKTYDISPDSLNLEITETASDEFTGIVDDNVRALHELGINFSLDDFGTGYSSLRRILALPLKIIKLDKTLVQPAFRYYKQGLDPSDERVKSIKNTNALTLLKSYIDMIKRIGGQIVAEGVETKEQAEEIIKLGCDYIQGFYFARPMPEEEFIKLIKQEEELPQIRGLEV